MRQISDVEAPKPQARPLTCDVCREPIHDTRRAMVFFHIEAGRIVGFMVCHKGHRGDPNSCDPRWFYSWELQATLADPARFWTGLTGFCEAPAWVRKKLSAITGLPLPTCTLETEEGLHS